MTRPDLSTAVRPTGNRPDRNLALELARVTEAAALGAGRWIGRGDKEAADQAAVDGMRAVLDTVAMAGVVVIGEGEKDEAPMLYNGEEVGDGHGPAVDVAVDPLEGTRLTAKGQPNAIAVIALAERGSMFFPGAAVYMDKIACGPEALDVIDIEAPPRENVERVARVKGVKPNEISVVVLERDRHEALIDELRDVGAKVLLIPDGDVAPAIAAAQPGTGCRPADGHRRHSGGRDRGGGAEVRRRRRPGQALATQRRGAPAVDRRRLRSRPRAPDGRPGLRPGRLRRRDRRYERRAPRVRYTQTGAFTDSIVMRSRSGTVGGSRRPTPSTSSRSSGPRVPIAPGRSGRDPGSDPGSCPTGTVSRWKALLAPF